MRVSPTLLCAALVLTSGCTTPADELRQSRAALADEREALIRQYHQCLELAVDNLKVDCSGYRTAVEVFDARRDSAN